MRWDRCPFWGHLSPAPCVSLEIRCLGSFCRRGVIFFHVSALEEIGTSGWFTTTSDEWVGPPAVTFFASRWIGAPTCINRHKIRPIIANCSSSRYVHSLFRLSVCRTEVCVETTSVVDTHELLMAGWRDDARGHAPLCQNLVWQLRNRKLADRHGV